MGAYEAGAIAALVSKAGVAEGQPLPDYGVVCGTSIGALNAYLVATAQWERLRNIWSTIATQNVIRLKPKYAKIANSSSGVANRLAQAIGLAIGISKNVQGVLDGELLQEFLESYLDLSRPIVTPIFWVTTNVTQEVPQYFYLVPAGYSDDRLRFGLDSAQRILGPLVPIRQGGKGRLLVTQLRASAAIPLAFDPVDLPNDKGGFDQYVDGGVVANTPLSAARALSNEVDAILVGPPFKGTIFDNALQVLSASFGTMQRVEMYDAMRLAWAETFLLQTLRAAPPQYAQQFSRSRGLAPGELQVFTNLLADTTFFVLRPEAALPVSVFGFDDAKALAETYQIGLADGAAGFEPFSESPFIRSD